MKVNIIRGQNQIGGSIIEVSTNTTRIILDVGSELDEDTPTVPAAEGLFQGTPAYQAIIISHYHGDHIGLLEHVLPGTPIYMGAKANSVYKAFREYTGKSIIETTGYLRSEKTFIIGDIKVTPFLCDHSAFDSYMILLENEGRRILYTGDFRSNGRKSYPRLISSLSTVDILITEGTNLSRTQSNNITEQQLEDQTVKIMSQAKGPIFVLMASTNIDRLVTMYRASKRSGRIFLEDTYTSIITTTAGQNIPNPITFSDVKTFLPFPTEKQYEILQQFGKSKIGRSQIAKKHFTMCVRPSMKSYLEHLSKEMKFNNGYLIYSLWEGYQAKPDMAAFLNFAKEKGLSIQTLHTSGHADEKAFNTLIDKVKPKYIIPVHTENASWFEHYNSKVIYSSDFVY